MVEEVPQDKKNAPPRRTNAIKTGLLDLLKDHVGQEAQLILQQKPDEIEAKLAMLAQLRFNLFSLHNSEEETKSMIRQHLLVDDESDQEILPEDEEHYFESYQDGTLELNLQQLS